MVKRIIVWASIAVLAAGTAKAQEAHRSARTVTLDELFALAEENEARIQTGKAAAEIASMKVKEARMDRLPDISASLSASYIGDGWMADRDFSNGQNAPMPHFGNNFAFEATQVIYSGGALKSAQEMAEIGERIAGSQLELTRQQVRLMIAGYYLDLFRMENQKVVYRNNVELMRQLVGLGRSRESQGAALKNDVTRYELQLAEMELALDNVMTESNVTNYRICTMLGMDSDTMILPDTTLLARAIDCGSEEYWQDAGTESPSVSVATSSASMARASLRMARSSMIPKIAVTAANHLDGPVLIEVPPLNCNFNYWYIGLGLKIDLGALYKSVPKVKQAKSGILQAGHNSRLVMEETAVAVHSAYERYQHSLNELETQVKNVELAGENYRIILNRYENGLSLVTDMVDAANMKLSAELAEANARINVIYAFYRLRYAAGRI